MRVAFKNEKIYSRCQSTREVDGSAASTDIVEKGGESGAVVTNASNDVATDCLPSTAVQNLR